MPSTDTCAICVTQAHRELTAWFVGGTRVPVHIGCWIAAYERTCDLKVERGLHRPAVRRAVQHDRRSRRSPTASH